MYELIQIGSRSYYINCPAKVGIYRQKENEVFLIDSGNDKEAGKKILRLTAEKCWRIKGIINTHSHADHIGGNRYLQEQTGCKIFADGIEAAFIRYPELEPAFLYGGNPPEELRHKFLMAQASNVCHFDDPEFPRELEIIPLPGHFFAMTGLRTPDQAVFLADSLSSPETLEKYQVVFLYDTAAYLQTLDKIAQLKAEVFVPAHAEVSGDLANLIELNRAKVYEIAAKIVSWCENPQNIEALLQRLFHDFGLTMTIEQYVLVGSTLRSYLSWLKSEGKLCFQISDNQLLWQKAGFELTKGL